MMWFSAAILMDKRLCPICCDSFLEAKDLSRRKYFDMSDYYFIYIFFTYRSGEEKKRREKKSKQ